MIELLYDFIKGLIEWLLTVGVSLALIYGGYHLISYMGDNMCVKYSKLYNLPYIYDISYGCKLKFEGKWYSPDKYELEIIRPKYYNGEMVVINKQLKEEK